MSQNISKDEVEKVSTLSRLRLSLEEAIKYANQISEILDYVDRLPESSDAVSLESTAPTKSNFLRDDIVRPSAVSQKDLLSNTPKINGTSIDVPAVFEN